MDDIVAKIQQLQKHYDDSWSLNEDYLNMFQLAGYELYETDDEGKSRPKTVKELLQEALKNPPEDAGNWIRIVDIPSYIRDYLVVPDKQALDSFNDGNRIVSTKSVANQEPEEEITFGDNGEPDDYVLTGTVWKTVAEIPVGAIFIDEIGTGWKKQSANQYVDENFDPKVPDYSKPGEVSQFKPFREIAFKD